MEISPRELRDAEIADSFRGYNRDIVDEFLERAAATIEALQERNRQLTERLQAALAQAEAAQAQAAAAASAAPPAPVAPAPPAPPVAVEPEPEPEPAPVPAPAPEPAPLPVVAASTAVETTSPYPDDLIQRTLLMAQKAADETVAEADQYALRTREEANTDAARTIADANAEAERISAERRADLDRTLRELEARRTDLETGLDALERFDSDYRARLRSAIESDLASIERRPILAPGTRPAITPLSVDAIEAGGAPEALGAGQAALGEAGDDGIEAVVVAEPDGDDEPVAMLTLDDEPDEAVPASTESADAAVSADALDDDEFFASLREAVHDDAPLGPLDRDGGLFPKE